MNHIEPETLHPATIPSPVVAAVGPLSPEHMRALGDARMRAKKVRRAAGVAAFSGWTMAIFAGITFLGVLFGDMTSLVVAASLVAVACNELRGGAMVRRFEPRGARVLGYNQFFLGAIIVGYAGWSILAVLRDPMLKAAGGSTGDPKIDQMVSELTTLVTYGLYGGMALVGIVAPALTAWYYFSRERLIRAMTEQTPAWVIETLRAAG